MLKGTVRYPNYNGFKIKGQKNKRVRKREALRRIEREKVREANKRTKSKQYSKRDEE